MKRISIIVFVFIFCLNLYGQTDTAYILTYGGIQNDVCNQIKATNDGGYIMIGTSNSFGCGNTDFYAVKIDSLGKHEWTKTYGGTENEEGFSVTQTFDHGYAFVGFTDSYGDGGYDIYFVKTDSAGNFQWQRTYGGEDWDFGYSIQQLPDSGYIICGLTYSYGPGNGNAYVIRTNKIGDTLWTRTIGDSGKYNVANMACVANDSIYAIVGNTTSNGFGDTNVLFVLLDNKGIIKKDTTYGLSTTSNIGNSIRETLDHGFVIFGNADTNRTYPGKPDEMLIKTDSAGHLQWLQIYATLGTSHGHDAEQESDGTYVAVSTSNAYGYGGYAMRIWHIYSNGIPFKGPSLGGVLDEQGNSIAKGKNGNMVFAGASDSPGYTEGLYDAMAIRWINDDSINDIRVNYIENFYDTSKCTLGIESQSIIYPEVKIFPNPVSSSSTILLQGDINSHYFFNVYNSAGELVIGGMPLRVISHGQYIGNFDKGNLATGMYIYQILNQSSITVASGKIVIE